MVKGFSNSNVRLIQISSKYQIMETKQSVVSRLDENVILTMLAVSVLATIIFAFRYKNYQPCTPFTIRTNAVNYHTGEVVRFETNARAYQRLQWSFGDNQNNETKIASAVHAYDQPGTYTVALSQDNECTQYKTVVITAAPKAVNPLMLPTFMYPQSAEVGKPVSFKDTTKGAAQWEWRFGETATIDAVAANPTYVYTTPGLKTVSLVVNNNPQQLGVVKIFVNPAIIKPSTSSRPGGGGGGRPIIVIADRPQNDPIGQNPAVEPPPMAQDITKEQMEAELRLVADKQRTVQSFLPYLCGNANVQVSLNSKETTFTALCEELGQLKNAKKIKALNVQMVKNERHCIIALVVNLKKKDGWWIF